MRSHADYTSVIYNFPLVKMQKRKTDVLYEKGTGAELYTSREAARFLGYHPVAFRNLVSKGKIRVHSRTGYYPLFLKEELAQYQATNKWAGKKAKVKPAAIALPAASRGLVAVITATLGKKETIVETLKDFKWDDAPAIRARVSAKYGRVPFRIAVKLPDGAGCTISFHASTAKRFDQL